MEEMINAIFVGDQEYFHKEGEINCGKVYIHSHIGSRLAQEDALYFADHTSTNKLVLAAVDGLG